MDVQDQDQAPIEDLDQDHLEEGIRDNGFQTR